MSLGRRLVVALLSVAIVLTPVPAYAGEQAGDGQWHQLDTRGLAPSERSAPAVTGIGKNVYVFGGVFDDFAAGENTFLNDLYRLDTRKEKWRPVHTRGTPPPARAFAGVASHQASDRMYVFGGSVFSADNTEFTAFGDFWAFDERSRRWVELDSDGGPDARSGSVMWTVGDTLYLFGGIDATFSMRNDLWAYDIGADEWDLVQDDGDPSAPPPRHVAQAGQTAPDGVLTIYGGEGLGEQGFTLLDDTWQFDLATGTWSEVTPAVDDIDPPRNYGAAAVAGEALYLQGGDIPGGSAGCGAPFPQNPTEELWRFDLATQQWQQLEPGGDPLPALKRHAAAVVDDTVYVVSGWDFECENDQGPGQIWNLDVFAYTPATTP